MPANVTNLTSGTYDLLYLDESSGAWKSLKNHSSYYLYRGQGYIFRRSTDATLTFLSGIPYSGSFTRTLDFSCADANLKGFNLMGNPYSVAYTPTMDYYTLNTDGTWQVHPASTGSVAVTEGFLIHTDVEEDYQFTEPSGTKSASGAAPEVLSFTLNDGQHSDVAYARSSGEAMPKFSHLDPSAPVLSIPMGGRNYAIARLPEGATSFPLKVGGYGYFTLSVDGTSDYSYLHLVDHAMKTDIDLLSQPTYSFTADGSADRFTVRLAPGNESGPFAWQEGDKIMVSGSGTLEVYDVMGRRLGSATVDGITTLGRHELGIHAAGIYVLRLAGNSQKIVIK